MWNRKKLPRQFDGRVELLRSFPDHKEEVERLVREVGCRETLWRLLVGNRRAEEEQIQWLPQEKPRDAVYIWLYKVQPCSRSTCDPALCFDFHSAEDHRRAITLQPNGLWSYKSTPCKGAQLCSGSTCTLANTAFEELYHPTRYRTTLCQYRRNILGICRLGLHCPNAHDTSELRTPAPNIVQILPQWNEEVGIDKEEDKRPAEREEVGLLSLSELLRTRLSKVTHEMIEGLQAAQQEKLRCDLELKETQRRIEEIERRAKCCNCQSKARSRLLSCGHQLCDSCSQSQGAACSLCARPVMAVLLKDK
jgi:hypothetical protein